MRGRPVRILLLIPAMLACAGAALSAAPAVAATPSGGGVSAGPLHYDPSNPATRAYFIQAVAPGGTFSDQVRLDNPNPGSVDLDVNAVDGVTATPTGAVYANRGDPVRKAGAWVTPALSTLTMASHQDTLVAFTVRVPADATPGDHLAGIAFENAHPTPGSGSISIASVIRTVVGILIKVPGPAAFALQISAASIQPLSNQDLSSVVITLTDDGLLLGHPYLTVSLRGPAGYHRTVSRLFDTVLPADTIALPFPWPDNLAPGAYTITVNGTAAEMAGTTVGFSSAARLGAPLTGVPDPAVAAALPPARSAGSPPLPWWVTPLEIGAGVAVLALLSLGVSLAVVLRRQRQRVGVRGGTATE